MSWIIILPIGAIAGIVMAVKYPEFAQTIADSIVPILYEVWEKLNEIAITTGKSIIAILREN
ncbi:MAG: hypothetical protein OPY03_05015 [Nitrosopumilus sp.]|nr:hypothetical protein [Nitrosopumilus sp.]